MSKNMSTSPTCLWASERLHVLLQHLLHTWAQGAALARWEEPESVGPGGSLLLSSTSHSGPISCLTPFFQARGRGTPNLYCCKHRGARFFYKGNVISREVIDMDRALVCSQQQRAGQNRSVWRREHLSAFCEVTLLKTRLIVMYKHK